MRLKAGDCVAVPPETPPHGFRVLGDKPLRLLGIHADAERVTTYLERETDAHGYPVLDDALEPVTATRTDLNSTLSANTDPQAKAPGPIVRLWACRLFDRLLSVACAHARPRVSGAPRDICGDRAGCPGGEPG